MMSKTGAVKMEIPVSITPTPNPKGARGRKKKGTERNGVVKEESDGLKQEMITDHMPVVKKRKIDRFNGMPEEEVVMKLLPDRLAPNLDILIVGINPGLFAAYIGHHYAGPGNHFWKCLYLSGLVPEPMNCYDDIKLQEFGIGFTNMCARTTRGSADLKRTEIQEGATILIEKLKEYKPKIAVFNGKGIYEVFSGNKKFTFGKQPMLIEGTDTIAYVMPSSSARCAQLPRAIDKVPFYAALRTLRDYVVGRIPHLDEAEVTFPTLELKNLKKEDPALKAENGEAGVSVSSSNSASGAIGLDQQNGLDLRPIVKQEGAKRGRPKGKGKKKGDEQGDDQVSMTEAYQSNEDQIIMTKSYQQGAQPQQSAPAMPTAPQYQQNLHHHQNAQGLPPNSSVSTGFTSLHPASATTAHFVPSLQSPCTSWPGMPPTFSTASQPPQDFMSGFFPGSHQFGMIGFPTVVASLQHCTPSAEDDTAKDSVQIKAEPLD